MFEGRGYINHLIQTRDPRCVVVYEQLQASLPGIYEDNPELESDDLEPALFEGDFFGDYTAEDFEDPHTSSSSDPAAESSDEDEDDDHATLPASWEPQPSSRPCRIFTSAAAIPARHTAVASGKPATRLSCRQHVAAASCK